MDGDTPQGSAGYRFSGRIPQIYGEPRSFFSLSPAVEGKILCFATRRGIIAQQPIWCSKFTPNLIALYESWSTSQFYRGSLSDWVSINPPSDISFLEDTEEVSFLPMEAVHEDGAGYEAQKRIYLDVSKGYTRFQENDLLWAKITPCMENGKATVVRNLNFGVGFGSTEFHVLRAKSDEADIDFVQYLLAIDELKKAAQGTFSGTAGQQRVPKEFLRDLPLPLPPLEIQRALVTKMEAARHQRQERLAEAQALLDGVDEVIIKELSFKLPENKKHPTFAIKQGETWQRFDAFFYKPYLRKVEEMVLGFEFGVTHLEDLLEMPPLNGVDARTYLEQGETYLRVQNIRPFEISLEDAKYVKVENKKDIALQVGDVLLTRKGTFGVAAVVTENDIDSLISSEIILLRLRKDSGCSPEFLAAWLNSEAAQILLDRYKSGGIMGHITQSVVNQFPVPVASPQTQKRIEEELQNRRSKARQLRAEAETLWQAAKDEFERALLG